MAGAMGMFVCFMIFASIGHFELEKDNGNNKSAGYVMIIFACLFILAYATTWGPIVCEFTVPPLAAFFAKQMVSRGAYCGDLPQQIQSNCYGLGVSLCSI